MDTPRPRRSYFALIASLVVLAGVVLVVLARAYFGGGPAQPAPEVRTPVAAAPPRPQIPDHAAPDPGPVASAIPLNDLPPPPPPPEEGVAAQGEAAPGALPVIENPDALAPESALPPPTN